MTDLLRVREREMLCRLRDAKKILFYAKAEVERLEKLIRQKGETKP